jgi:hypothetical protein
MGPVGQFQFSFARLGPGKEIEKGKKLWGGGSINRTLLKELWDEEDGTDKTDGTQGTNKIDLKDSR